MTMLRECAYAVSTTQRFEVSSDPYSQARLEAVTKSHKLFKRMCPWYVGSAIFGSLSKGKPLNIANAEQTDVDVTAFVDTDGCEDGQAALDELVAEDIFGLFNQFHPQDLPLPELSIMVRRISRTRSHQGSLAYLLQYLEDMNKLEDDFSLGASGVVAAPFALDISGDLKPYIATWLSDAAELKAQTGHDEWIPVGMCTRLWERGNNIPESLSRFYPQTLEEALKYYDISR